MTKQKEIFTPKDPENNKVCIYVCGVTSYDDSHVGHARTSVIFNVLVRKQCLLLFCWYLSHLGYEVIYVRNMTDIDDKIIDNGYAYEVEGDVYFSVDKISDYGRLSGQKVEDNQLGKRVAIDPRKKNPADFTLWKVAKPSKPSWDRPWSSRRPEWHIECSAMSAHYLTSSFDIHGGGTDLIFPHHENKIAQSSAACSKAKVSYWMHNDHMTKDENMEEERSNSAKAQIAYDVQNRVSKLHNDFECKMSDDLHTPEFLKSGLQNALRFINNTLDMVKKIIKPLQKKPQPSVFQSFDALESKIKELLKILGLLWSPSYLEILESLKEKALKRANIKLDYALQKIEERAEARKHKDYLKADEIR
ncbi:hypothetical protein GIB67_034572 [Kingdonia uniflora]|uniref:tRNA synthetases class I catalytic domain-containing protein n=1 Tax=Kingdonia uniflora TaxID=39325 RepID=A0A7J7MXV3_9MAGN|nr:hypothetical protein GIB67_034572 [Kingdonia uniflora]